MRCPRDHKKNAARNTKEKVCGSFRVTYQRSTPPSPGKQQCSGRTTRVGERERAGMLNFRCDGDTEEDPPLSLCCQRQSEPPVCFERSWFAGSVNFSALGCRGGLLACGVLYFVMTMLATIKWSFRRPTAMDGVTLFSDDRVGTKKLAVIVPTHAGDLEDAIQALTSWPSTCSSSTSHHMHLVLYYSGSKYDKVWSEDSLSFVAQTGGRCFERTRVVFAGLKKEVMQSTGMLG